MWRTHSCVPRRHSCRRPLPHGAPASTGVRGLDAARRSACATAATAKLFLRGPLSKHLEHCCFIRVYLCSSVAIPSLHPFRRDHRLPQRDPAIVGRYLACLLYTSDAADDLLCVDLGG